MVGLVCEKGRARLGEERRPASISFRQDDLVEELDGRILGPGRLAFMNELIEALRLAQHGHVLAIAVRYTPQERVHVEVVDQSSLLALTRGRVHVATVCVEQGSEATHERGAHLILTESSGTNNAHSGSAAAMDSDVATRAFEDILVASFITDATRCLAVRIASLQAVAFCPFQALVLAHGLYGHGLQDRASCHSAWCVNTWSVGGGCTKL